jgi:hypothetical protein
MIIAALDMHHIPFKGDQLLNPPVRDINPFGFQGLSGGIAGFNAEVSYA